MVDVCISTVLFRRFEMVYYFTLCVLSEKKQKEEENILKLDLAATKAHFYTFCHIDSCKADSLYYKAFPYRLNDVGPF